MSTIMQVWTKLVEKLVCNVQHYFFHTRQLASQPNMTHCTDPHDTHMDQDYNKWQFIEFIHDHKEPCMQTPLICTNFILVLETGISWVLCPLQKPTLLWSNFTKCLLGVYRDSPKSYAGCLFMSSRSRAALFGKEHEQNFQMGSS